MVPAGKLREKVRIERFVRTDTPDGSWADQWVLVVDPLFCNVQQKTASVDIIASQANMIKPVYFTCRYRTDLPFRIGDRIVWRGRNFNIDSFTWDENRTTLLIIGHSEDETTSPDGQRIDSISPLTIDAMPADADKPTIVQWP